MSVRGRQRDDIPGRASGAGSRISLVDIFQVSRDGRQGFCGGGTAADRSFSLLGPA
jgi:hypothetical protein